MVGVLNESTYKEIFHWLSLTSLHSPFYPSLKKCRHTWIFWLCSSIPHSLCPSVHKVQHALRSWLPLFFFPPSLSIHPSAHLFLTAVGLISRHFSDFPPVAGWDPLDGAQGAWVTRCWPAVVALVWATQSPDGLSPLDQSELSSSLPLSGWRTHQSINPGQDSFLVSFFFCSHNEHNTTHELNQWRETVFVKYPLGL